MIKTGKSLAYRCKSSADTTQQLHGHYHHVYCDHYFMSALFMKLLELGTDACGTECQMSKDFPYRTETDKKDMI